MSKKVKYHRQKYSKTEFNESFLPLNRFRQFFDVIKIEWATLLRIGFLFLLFLLPLIAVTFLRPFVITSVIKTIEGNGGIQEDINFGKAVVNVGYYAICSICFLIFSICLAGVSKIFQNICFGEGVLFRNDFIKGIKENWKRFMFFSLISSICFLLININRSFFGQDKNFLIDFIIYLALLIFYIFVLPTFLFAMTNTTIYKMSKKECISNGFKFTCVKVLFTLIFALVIFGFSWIEFIEYPLIFPIILVVSIILLFPLFYLAFHLYALYISDEYINKEAYKEIYRKGLRPLI